ncbi:MAG: epoxyqueuosine reductase [Candidatus Korarchaeota archaeon]|nr:epoxyqueuosine reductase [Candidatus Korarchaeota archaeon]NIU84139.1 4Fe-4S dicluster domain-containing protein [Candidatus Thorarchaeota archaeon]NIW14284.1 4Fe-4S dicluster domain-containing protein [Candidatus Thorarchaeota archaeon]NIW52381.1 4Fe-4S dicluster domain-containing protein [Candidatus Korarchaeota archaeon]
MLEDRDGSQTYDVKFTEEVKKLTKKEGASLVGIGDFSRHVVDFWDNSLSHFSKAISLGIHLPDVIINEIYDGPTLAYANLYDEVNTKLDKITSFITETLHRNGYEAERIQASNIIDETKLRGRFPHKTAAVISRLGWIGKNALLITFEYGPRIRLATIFTDAPLQPDSPQKKSMCGDCEICVRACPVNAIKGNLWEYGISRKRLIDPHKCENHLKKYEKELGQPVCGICFAVCPYGEK